VYLTTLLIGDDVIEIIFLGLLSILILCLGIYVVIHPVVASERIKRFYMNYPLIRYAGEKQLTSRPFLVRLVGIIIIILGSLCFFNVLYV
jgi:uncharacterized membrane protein HdeD (DUF308 family)